MKTSCSRKGSALLIVIGMLAFMVVSAVAFSAYMRTSRLPSSYLRRTVASRMLAKAALAEAIDEIDAAVGNFPHPGVWMKQNADGSGLNQSENIKYQLTRTTKNTKAGHNSNAWLGRVYIGGVDDVGSVQSRVDQIKQWDTVPTLTLEALAYIPPSLVNEARYYSRHSNAGKWHTMPFDAGRYAFCAIDVSDFFDINALTADEKRTSGARDRISLAYLFENGADHSSVGNGAAQWDSFISSALAANVPLVSMADWNLAFGDKFGDGAVGDVKSYFYGYVSKSKTSFYGGEGTSYDSAEKIRRMAFVTDGWFPSEPTSASSGTSGATDVLDLSDPANQPFSEADLKSAAMTYYQVSESTSPGQTKLRKHIPNLALAMLYDYLDEDHVPLSLAIPSVERVPMVCGFDLVIDSAKLGVKSTPADPVSKPTKEPTVQTVTTTVTETYNLNAGDLLLGLISPVKAVVAYPFRHKNSSGAAENYTVDGGLAVFLTAKDTGTMGLRPGSAVEWLRYTDKDRFGASALKDGVILLRFKPQTITATETDDPSKAAQQVQMEIDRGDVESVLSGDNGVLFKATWECVQTAPANDQGTGYNWMAPDPADSEIKTKGTVTEAFCRMPPLTSDGAVDKRFTATGKELVDFLKSGVEVSLNVAVFLRVTDSDGKTVDLVPAYGECDKLNGVDNWSLQSKVILSERFGDPTPLMRFDTGGAFTFSVDGLAAAASSVTLAASPKGVMIADPRYNYAPESWFVQDTVDANAWYDKAKSFAAGGTGQAARRDGDIFMATSDQNYLQSVYELAYLPRIVERGFYRNSNGDEVGNLVTPNGFATTYAAGPESALNAKFMWRTYDPFMRYENDDVTFEDLNVVNLGAGFKINPYSDATNVMMAAFANTPHDWRCASTNERTNADIVNLDCKQFNQKYAWNAYSTGAKIAWDDLALVSESFMEAMRDSNGDDWEDVWADLPWYSDTHTGDEASKYFLDEALVETSDQGRLYNADKKFLYGYWHDCFAVKQQLYLVFVRAEPMLMGGGAVHQQPPQLGARAVALVWRDPKNRSTDTSKAHPHRTRVLFYRQFE